jgi:hypothetical protein
VKRAMTRDPQIDPQQGDELRAGARIRRVIERAEDRLLVEGWGQRYWMPVKTWQRWCEKTGAAVSVAKWER